MSVRKKTVLSRILSVLMLCVLCFGLVMPAYAAGDAIPGAGSVFDQYAQVDKDGNVTIPGGTDGEALKLGDVVGKYKSVAVVISSLLAITSIIFLLIQIAKLSAAGDNQMARSKAIAGIATSGVGIALFGGFSVVVGFFWNFLAGV